MKSFYKKEISKNISVEDVVNSCLMAISCPSGRFYPDKNYGNSIKRSADVGELLAAARQAVSSIDGVFVKGADVKNGVVEFELMINDDLRRVSVNIEQNL